jgi:hypothetical protein
MDITDIHVSFCCRHITESNPTVTITKCKVRYRMDDTFKGKIGFGLIILTAIMMVVSISVASHYVSSKDEYAAIKAPITTITVINALASAIFIAGIILLLSRYPDYAHIISIILAGIAICISLTAVSASVISKLS